MMAVPVRDHPSRSAAQTPGGDASIAWAPDPAIASLGLKRPTKFQTEPYFAPRDNDTPSPAQGQSQLVAMKDRIVELFLPSAFVPPPPLAWSSSKNDPSVV